MKFKIFIVTVAAILSFGLLTKAAFINDTAPAFTLKSLDEQEISLEGQQGKVVFINFWASWCPPCKQEFPELNELANEYIGHPFQTLAINLDKKPERIQAFLDKMKITPRALLILRDPNSTVVAHYVARSMPSSFIIDAKGVIRFVHFGYGEKDPAKWRVEVNQLLAEIPTSGKPNVTTSPASSNSKKKNQKTP